MNKVALRHASNWSQHGGREDQGEGRGRKSRSQGCARAQARRRSSPRTAQARTLVDRGRRPDQNREERIVKGYAPGAQQ